MRSFECVTREVRRTAIANPLKKNAGLAYFNADGSPCCVFGHALERLGITVAAMNGKNYTPARFLPWDFWGFDKPSDYQMRWCDKVQFKADTNVIWLKAVVLADFPLT